MYIGVLKEILYYEILLEMQMIHLDKHSSQLNQLIVKIGEK